MALIKKIRERTGMAVGVVAIALMLFILGGDLLNQNSIIRGKSSQDVGEIAGRDISLQQYQQEIGEIEQRYGGNVSEEQSESIREQAWESLISKVAFTEEFEELGVTVSQEELNEMLGGKNIDPNLKQYFTDPQTGEFNRAKLDSFYLSYNSKSPEQKKQINSFFEDLRRARQRIKYENLITKTVYVTKEEARREFENQTNKVDVKYLYVPFFSINDTTIKVTDEDIEQYIEKNKERYKGETTANIEYVTFKVIPSQEDTAAIMKELMGLEDDFKATKDDSAFAKINTDAEFNFNWLKPGELPRPIASQIASLQKGSVIGPISDNGSLKLLKLSDIKNDTAASVRASHILFKPDSESPEDHQKALQQANDILAEIKKGASFESMAMMYGTDGTKNQGGDLGWFTKGQMVKEFENAVFNLKGVGLVPQPVKSQFGYHLIKVTEPKSSIQYRVAAIEKVITPGSVTNDKAYRKASTFAGSSKTEADFRKNAAKDSIVISSAPRVVPRDKVINELTNTREIVRWIFNDAEPGEVSDVFSLEDNYVIVLVKSKFEEGKANIENLRVEITPKIRNDVKAKQIVGKLQNKKGTLEDIASKYGQGASVYTQAGVTYGSSVLDNAGYSPLAVGRAFGIKKGQRSAPIIDDNGVLIVEVTNAAPSPEIADYSMYKDQIQQRRESQARNGIPETIKKYAEIKDNRTKFY